MNLVASLRRCVRTVCFKASEFAGQHFGRIAHHSSLPIRPNQPLSIVPIKLKKRRRALDPLLDLTDMLGWRDILLHGALPKHLQSEFSVGSKGAILGYECQLVGDGLPDNQTVKRVFVFHAGQVVEGGGIGCGNRKYVKTRLTDYVRKIIRGYAGQLQLSGGVLEGNLPKRDYAD